MKSTLEDLIKTRDQLTEVLNPLFDPDRSLWTMAHCALDEDEIGDDPEQTMNIDINAIGDIQIKTDKALSLLIDARDELNKHIEQKFGKQAIVLR